MTKYTVRVASAPKGGVHRNSSKSASRLTSPARRFALAAIGDEGVVLDLATGGIYRARDSALLAFQALERGRGIAGAADAVARRYDVPRAVALADIRALLARPVALPAPVERPVSFESVKNGFAMIVSGRRALCLDRSTGRLEGTDAPDLLRAAAPHILTLQGRSVLHAAAVATPAGVIAFVGPSGIGKSTLAQAFVAGGYEPVSDDLVVLGRQSRVLLDGERAIRQWTNTGLRRPRSPIGRARPGTAPLVKIFIVTRGVRGSVPVTNPLRGSEAIAAMLDSAFVEIPDPAVWRAALTASARLAAKNFVSALRVPHGLRTMRAVVRAVASTELRS